MHKSPISPQKAIVLILIIIIITSVVLTACTDTVRLGSGQSTVYLIVGEVIYEISTDAVYLHDAIVDVAASNELTYDYTTSAYGVYIESIAELKPAKNEFISIYHDIADDTLIFVGYDYEYQNKDAIKTFYSSAVGVSSLPVRDGATYLILVSKF